LGGGLTVDLSADEKKIPDSCARLEA